MLINKLPIKEKEKENALRIWESLLHGYTRIIVTNEEEGENLLAFLDKTGVAWAFGNSLLGRPRCSQAQKCYCFKSYRLTWEDEPLEPFYTYSDDLIRAWEILFSENRILHKDKWNPFTSS